MRAAAGHFPPLARIARWGGKGRRGKSSRRGTGLSLARLWPYNWRMAKSNLLIGSTTLALIAVAFVGLLGYRKIHALRQQAPLRIVFEGSASGLRKGGSVNFDGV